MDGMLDYLMQDCIGPTQFYIGEGGGREKRKGEQLREKERGTKIEIERREGEQREREGIKREGGTKREVNKRGETEKERGVQRERDRGTGRERKCEREREDFIEVNLMLGTDLHATG